jgi:hypothetical protein
VQKRIGVLDTTIVPLATAKSIGQSGDLEVATWLVWIAFSDGNRSAWPPVQTGVRAGRIIEYVRAFGIPGECTAEQAGGIRSQEALAGDAHPGDAARFPGMSQSFQCMCTFCVLFLRGHALFAAAGTAPAASYAPPLVRIKATPGGGFRDPRPEVGYPLFSLAAGPRPCQPLLLPWTLSRTAVRNVYNRLNRAP